MSQVYRAHSPAQAIEEAVVIAAALALLAAVQAAPVPSTTPSRGIFKAEDAVRRKPWTALAVIAFAALAGAAVFGGGSESRDHTLLVNAAPSSAAPASAVEPAIAGAAPPAPAPERVTEADPAPSSKSQRATDATTTTTTLATAEPTGQSTSTSKDWRKASRERASRDDRRNVPSLTPTLPKRQRLRRRLRSLKLGMPQLQQRTRIVRSSSQTMSSCPITTNFVAFDEQQEVAVGEDPPPPSLSGPFAV